MERNYKKLDFVINHEDFDNEVTKILREIRPHWVNQVLVTKVRLLSCASGVTVLRDQ